MSRRTSDLISTRYRRRHGCMSPPEREEGGLGGLGGATTVFRRHQGLSCTQDDKKARVSEKGWLLSGRRGTKKGGGVKKGLTAARGGDEGLPPIPIRGR